MNHLLAILGGYLIFAGIVVLLLENGAVKVERIE